MASFGLMFDCLDSKDNFILCTHHIYVIHCVCEKLYIYYYNTIYFKLLTITNLLM